MSEMPVIRALRARAHGGDLVLGRTEADFTEFVATLPAAAPRSS